VRRRIPDSELVQEARGLKGDALAFPSWGSSPMRAACGTSASTFRDANIIRDEGMHIRSYRDADEAAVIALWHAAGVTRPWNDPAADIARKKQVQPELFLLAEVDGQVAGSIMGGYDGHRGWIAYLAVAPEQRRRGYARALVLALERQLLRLGCPKLNLQVRDDNLAALAFWERIGYARDRVVTLGKRLIADE
jgi:ribosomal protein S18 acetylase RimI-like enzyme